jgi:hypothetical protein
MKIADPTPQEITEARARMDAATEPLDVNTMHVAYRGPKNLRGGVWVPIAIGGLIPLIADWSRRLNLH